MISVIRRYLTIRPANISSAFVLYTGYLRALTSLILNNQYFESVGSHLKGSHEIEIKIGSLRAFARPKTDDIGILTLAHEPIVSSWFVPRRGEVFIDIGAHVGAYSIRAAIAGSMVIAVEPNKDNFALLRRNIELNRLDNVVLFNMALSDREGRATLYVPGRSFGRSTLLEMADESSLEDVCMTTVDSLMSKLPSPQTSIDWMKIDVEGSEIELLEGGVKTFNMAKRIIIEVNNKNQAECKEILLRKHGFKLAAVDKQESCVYWLLDRP